jgi:hypothetical protein
MYVTVTGLPLIPITVDLAFPLEECQPAYPHRQLQSIDQQVLCLICPPDFTWYYRSVPLSYRYHKAVHLQQQVAANAAHPKKSYNKLITRSLSSKLALTLESLHCSDSLLFTIISFVIIAQFFFIIHIISFVIIAWYFYYHY